MTTIDLDEAERMHEPRSPAHEDADIAAHARTFVPLAVARIRELEAARDAFRAQAEASLVVPCACGRPMPSVSSRLRCDACRAERKLDQARATLRAAANRARGIAQSAADDEAALAVLGPLVAERDEARSACAAMREAVESARLTVVRHSRDWSRHDSDAWLYGLLVGWPADVVPQLPGAWPQNPSETARLSRLSAAFASDAGAPLLAELRALRAVRDAAEAFLSPPTLHAIGDARERLRAALDAAKVGG